MAVRKFKPTTPGQRHKIIGTFEEITASVPEKSLVYGKRSTGGRNNVGKMTMRYLGGGHKRKFRWIDFKRDTCVFVEIIEIFQIGKDFQHIIHHTDIAQTVVIGMQKKPMLAVSRVQHLPLVQLECLFEHINSIGY